ncbi:MAG: DUF58 domain-containing protein [Verrucomicrobiales bacterium]
MKERRTETTIQLPGVVLLWVSFAVLVGGLLALSAPLILVGLIGFVVLLACRCLAARHLLGLEATRPLPGRAFAGESFPVEATLANRSSFLAATEFAFRDPVASSSRETRLTVFPGEPRQLRYTDNCPRRGVFRSLKWIARSRWPLGLYRTEHHGEFSSSGTADEVLVMPRPFLPSRLRRHLDKLLTGADILTEHYQDPSADFRLLREFRPGDPVRGIHWPSSLRSGQLQVRQSDPPAPRPVRTGIVVHAYAPAGRVVTPETFEMILRIAAALLIRFRDAEVEVDFQLLPDGRSRLSARSDFLAALERLARVRRQPLPRIEDVTVALPPFADCDETFVLGDCPRSNWEPAARAALPSSTCIDTASLAIGGRPVMRTRELAS